MQITREVRQKKIIEIVRAMRFSNHKQIQKYFERIGCTVTQPSISRDLVDLGISKVNGVYRLPSYYSGDMPYFEVLSINKAGDNLVVVKVPPGQAPLVALTIDQKKVPEIVGTVAGDDTIFVAVKGEQDQKRAIRKIITFLKPKVEVNQDEI
jgi:transcriptional regulator of arginine metabolism